MQINNVSSPNFCGYKNVIANKVRRKSTGETITFMSMQLDNIGKNDLDIWKTIQKHFMKRDFVSDVITFELMQLNEHSLLGFSSDVIDIDAIKPNTKNENLFLKSMSLLASLTGRIMNDKNLIRDENYKPLAYEAKADLMDVLMSKKNGELDRAIWGSFYTDTLPQERAKAINEVVADTMMKYFG